MRLNLEEICWGMGYGFAFYPIIGLRSLFLAPLCGVLWALSGAGFPKFLRRIGVPVASALCVLRATGNLWVLPITVLAYCVLSIGYGIPDSTDEGSALGRFWYRLVGESYANLATRLTIIVLLIASYLPLLIK